MHSWDTAAGSMPGGCWREVLFFQIFLVYRGNLNLKIITQLFHVEAILSKEFDSVKSLAVSPFWHPCLSTPLMHILYTGLET